METVKTQNLVAWMEHRQIGLYLAVILAGGAVGILAPGSAGPLERAINLFLGLPLYARAVRSWESARNSAHCWPSFRSLQRFCW